MREPDTVPWLVISLVLSVLLTVILNVALRAFPDASRRIARGVTKHAWPTSDETRTGDRAVRVWMPWKAMIVGSIVLTILLNLWIARE